MKIPLKLNSIDQEHLQELYDAAGVARDELPYTPAFDELVQGFQDRTFKNADPEQIFGGMLKYTRSSTNAAKVMPPHSLNEEQMKQLKAVLSRYKSAGKILPYSDEFNSAHKEFNQVAGLQLTEQEFWRGILAAQGGNRRPPPRRKSVAVAKNDDADVD